MTPQRHLLSTSIARLTHIACVAGLAFTTALLGGCKDRLIQHQPISYAMENGMSGTLRYLDHDYDGAGDPTVDLSSLFGGLGVLTDGIVPEREFDAAPGWVGWASRDPVITFDFGKRVEIERVSLYVDSPPASREAARVDPPSEIRLRMNGKEIFYPVGEVAPGEAARIDIKKLGFDGQYLEIQLIRKDLWVMIGEAAFYGRNFVPCDDGLDGQGSGRYSIDDPACHNPEVEALSHNRVRVNFDCDSDAEQLDLYRGINTDDPNAMDRIYSEYVCNNTEAGFDDTYAQPGRQYCYQVRKWEIGGGTSETVVRCVTTPQIERGAGPSDLDAPEPSDGMGQLEMMSGRMTKVPVSWYWTNEYTPPSDSSATSVAFRSSCSVSASAAGYCDTAMIATWEVCDANSCKDYAAVNDDDPDPEQHGTGSGRGSYVKVDLRRQIADSISLTVFSRQRATSKTSVEYSLDNGGSWSKLASSMHVGGTVVDVGPLIAGDTLEVMTRREGILDQATQMLLFSDEASVIPVESVREALGFDPHIDVPSGWNSERGYLLIGKVAQLNSSQRWIESFVDLERGPVESMRSASLTGCAGGPCSLELDPGRHLVMVYATLDFPVGEYQIGDPSTHNPASDMPVLSDDNDGCPSQSRDGNEPEDWYRGTPNGPAFSMIIEEQFIDVATGNPLWIEQDRRTVPRGAFGTGPTGSGDGWNKFVMPLEVSRVSTIRVRTESHVPSDEIDYFGSWRSQRNPQATELKVVSYNMLFDDENFNESKFRNAANLFGTRGNIKLETRIVEMRRDQADFQWEADIIGLQEVYDDDGNYVFSDIMHDELEAKGAEDWAYSVGQGEHSGWVGTMGLNSMFTREAFWPGGQLDHTRFSSGAMSAAGCSQGSRAEWQECRVVADDDLADNAGDINNFTTPTRASVWRDGDTKDRPITVFDVHLEASDGARDFGARLAETRDLMGTIDALLAAQPEAFNRSGSANPKHYQNRIIILGDWNVRCHECGEHYWLLRELRDHYGYAVDTAMAVYDADGNLSYGMHNGNDGYDATGVPFDYQHMWADDPIGQWLAWNSPDTPHDRRDSDYPWWAADWRSKTGDDKSRSGERLSMVFLVGKGWAYDDAVLDYRLLNDRSVESPMHTDGRAVEQWVDCDTAGMANNDATSYAPNHWMGCSPTSAAGSGPGAPALSGDHKPIGVRLRVWDR
jgi:endonuclease/exonuclease/phosphatase family metal-dependent hydrolase